MKTLTRSLGKIKWPVDIKLAKVDLPIKFRRASVSTLASASASASTLKLGTWNYCSDADAALNPIERLTVTLFGNRPLVSQKVCTQNNCGNV